MVHLVAIRPSSMSRRAMIESDVVYVRATSNNEFEIEIEIDQHDLAISLSLVPASSTHTHACV